MKERKGRGESWPRGEECEGSSTGGLGKDAEQGKEQKENGKTGRKNRYSRGGIRGKRVPLQEIRMQDEQPRLREKRKIMLRDEPDEMMVDSDTMEQGRTKVLKKEVQMEALLRVTEAVPKGPPRCQ